MLTFYLLSFSRNFIHEICGAPRYESVERLHVKIEDHMKKLCYMEVGVLFKLLFWKFCINAKNYYFLKNQ